MAFTVRPLTTDDADAVHALLRRSSDGRRGMRRRDATIEDGLGLLGPRAPLEGSGARSTHGLLDAEGTLRGICETVSHWPAPGTAHISLLLVDGSTRGRGLGRLLHDSVVAQLRADGVRRLRTDTLTAASPGVPSTEETEETKETEGPRERDPVGFWEHLGYRPTGAPLAALDRSVEHPARNSLRELVPVVPEPRAGLHHLELWTAALAVTAPSWHWMLTTLGWTAEPVPGWDTGRIWRHDDGSYLVLEQSPDTLGQRSERRGPGMNHVAFTVRSRAELDALRAEAPAHGWTELFSGAFPHAGGPDHTAWYGEDPEGIEVELVAATVPAAAPDGAAEDSPRS